MKIRRVAILTLSVGAGHLRAAEAVHRAVYAGGDDVDARTIDLLKHSSRWFLAVYVTTYWQMLRRAPWMWRWLFIRRQKKMHRKTAPWWIFRRGCRAALEQLKTLAPHLVIATEVGAAEFAAMARRGGWFDAPIIAVQTDFYTEPPWVQPEIDVYCVASEEAKSQLISWGVSSNRVVTCGIPVDSAFALRFDRAELFQALGLDAGRPVVLVMGGGMGPAPLDQIVERLAFCRQPLQVLAVAGNNRELRARLEALRGRVMLDLHVFGWTDKIPELMAVSNLLITKPGGVTAAEALAVGLPMVLTHPIPGPEELHLRYLAERAVAVEAKSLNEIPGVVSALLADGAALKRMTQQAREAARPDAAFAVAQIARAVLEKGTYIDLLASPTLRPDESIFVM